MKNCLVLSVISLFFLIAHPSFLYSYSDGGGTISNPFQISTAADLKELMDTSDDWDKHFILTDDVDCSGMNNPSPIGIITDDNEIPFTGTFDGNDYTISNLTIEDDIEYYFTVGLFGYIYESRIWDLTIRSCSFSGVVSAPIGICEYSTITNCHFYSQEESIFVASGFIGEGIECYVKNCSSHGSAKAFFDVSDGNSSSYQSNSKLFWLFLCGTSGFVYYAKDCNFLNCYSNVDVSSDDVLSYIVETGGFFCESYFSSFRNCSASGNVETGGAYAGGFGVYTFDSKIIDCFSTGNVKTEYGYSGGFLSFMELSEVAKSYSTGNVSGYEECGGFCGGCFGSTITESFSSGNVNVSNSYSGGFVDYIDFIEDYDFEPAQTNSYNNQNDEELFPSEISDCYSTGNVSAEKYAGGFIEFNWKGNIQRCYSVGKVTANQFAGGFCSEDEDGTYVCNFWDTQTSGLTNGFGDGNTDSGVQGKETSEMKEPEIFATCGWDLDKIWFQPSEDSYLLLWNVTIPTLTELAAIVFSILLLAVGGYYIYKN